ncbi:biotin--[acetyl-CoA-carboxylase] ligase [Streptomyces sp. NBC_00316]|uniref:biotin--[acetyl-CoA-carboxylase] ligase n=1 Tax=Streptomyces sp. NBC_00316 TaxID=2975710 RepID=UPI002E2878E7|nr:biotin--[acetyl-CoA-carboxylase] ligase [Streptomyces sp. NBC_00316]
MTPPDASPNRWSDLDRPPLNVPALRRGLLRPGALWTSLDVVDSTGSTNTDLAARAAELAEGTVLVAEEQTAGRGRLDRSWTAPARSGLFFSVYLVPGDDVPVHRWGWLPLLAGVATATGLAKAAGVDTALKWPNDLLVDVAGEERKAGGILAERAGNGVVVGIGLNVTLRAAELPAPTAASLSLAGAVSTDRETLLRGVLRSLDHWYVEWRAAGGDAARSGLQAAYAAGCATLGRTVRAQLPGDRSVVGEAVAVDGDGRLILSTADGVQEPLSAADIIHLRGTDDTLT